MIEISTVVLLVAAEIGKGVAGEVGKSVWEGISAAYEKWRGGSPEPDDIDADAARSLASEIRSRSTALHPGSGPHR